jgi:hypothetical protein
LRFSDFFEKALCRSKAGALRASSVLGPLISVAGTMAKARFLSIRILAGFLPFDPP